MGRARRVPQGHQGGGGGANLRCGSSVLIDVDGVLTDGRLYISAEGETLKAFQVLDGHGLKLLGQAGITPIVITGRDSPAVRRRLADLGLTDVHFGVADSGQADSEDGLLQRADQALYRAKHAGRNRVEQLQTFVDTQLLAGRNRVALYRSLGGDATLQTTPEGPVPVTASGASRPEQPLPTSLFAACLGLFSLSAFAMDAIGIHAVFGGFLLGCVMPRGPLVEKLRSSLQPFVVVFLLPMFFTYSGLNTRLDMLFDPAIFVAALAILAASFGGPSVLRLDAINSKRGAALDSVRVVEVPIPAAAGLFGFGLAAAALLI